MRTRPIRTVAFCLMSLLAPLSSYSTPIVNFDFDESAGTALVSGVASSVGGYTWAAASGDVTALSGIVTDGSGNLNVSYDNTTLRDATITLEAADQILTTQNSHVQLVLEVAPWSFSAHSGRNEQLRFGLGNTSATNVFAIVHLTRTGANQVAVETSALGSGATAGTPTVLFGDVSTDPVKFVLDINKVTNIYGLSYKVGTEPLLPVPGNSGLSLSPDRNGNYVRLGFDETFSDDTFAISRVALLAVPEPTTISLALLTLATCASRRQKHNLV